MTTQTTLNRILDNPDDAISFQLQHILTLTMKFNMSKLCSEQTNPMIIHSILVDLAMKSTVTSKFVVRKIRGLLKPRSNGRLGISVFQVRGIKRSSEGCRFDIQILIFARDISCLKKFWRRPACKKFITWFFRGWKTAKHSQSPSAAAIYRQFSDGKTRKLIKDDQVPPQEVIVSDLIQTFS